MRDAQIGDSGALRGCFGLAAGLVDLCGGYGHQRDCHAAWACRRCDSLADSVDGSEVTDEVELSLGGAPTSTAAHPRVPGQRPARAGARFEKGVLVETETKDREVAA
ncbi:MAG: hypothetical protein M0Z95_24355 [Actinomycetota bacterium]|nr:hypothetical protein [Actinomycetota bacterium]